jgi:hypothetical protein
VDEEEGNGKGEGVGEGTESAREPLPFCVNLNPNSTAFACPLLPPSFPPFSPPSDGPIRGYIYHVFERINTLCIQCVSTTTATLHRLCLGGAGCAPSHHISP